MVEKTRVHCKVLTWEISVLAELYLEIDDIVGELFLREYTSVGHAIDVEDRFTVDHIDCKQILVVLVVSDLRNLLSVLVERVSMVLRSGEFETLVDFEVGEILVEKISPFILLGA